MAIRTFSPALCPGALEGEGKRDAVAIRAGAAVFPTLEVTVGVTTVGLGVTAAVLLGRGVGVGVGVGVGSGVGQSPRANPLVNSSNVYI